MKEFKKEFTTTAALKGDYKKSLCGGEEIQIFHISHELKQSEHFYNKDYTDFHEHDFYSVVLRGSEEPKAFYLTDLKTEKEVLQSYVDMNADGTPHSNEEIERVNGNIQET